MGVGSEFRGDDSVGPEVIKSMVNMRAKNVLFIATQMPENFVSKIADFRPDQLIVIDSADFGARPGEFRIVDKKLIDSTFLSTHHLPLTVFMKESGCKKIVFIAVQYKTARFGSRMSTEVKSSVDEIKKLVETLI
jgi:hydrogenase 3 maturation protease